MSTRRFNEAEVAFIFRQATEAQADPKAPLPSGEGLTLAELTEIGREVGIAPELVARAAASVATPGRTASQTLLGLPIGVERRIEFDRNLTDAEWERLVVDLRETFNARGTVRRDGSLRQWTNGNLQVLLEPSEKGQRIRFRTVHGRARAWLQGAGVTLAVSAVVALAAVSGDHRYVTWALEIAALGAVQLFLGANGLPSWARLRRTQMDEVSGRLAGGMRSLSSHEPEA